MVIRLKRGKKIDSHSVLDPAKIAVLWEDPLFRTSNVLSGLFHDVAILVEGESDARFLSSTLAALFKEEHLPDAEFFSTNGKSKMHLIAAALRQVEVPVVAVADMDIIANVSELQRLYKALGGTNSQVLSDATIVHSSIIADRHQLTGRQFKSDLDSLTCDLDLKKPVPESVSAAVRILAKNASPWARLKINGRKGIADASAVKAFDRLCAACEEVGLLINPEGELEGLCRTVSRSNKGEWLAEVLKRNLRSDPDLADARLFTGKLAEIAKIRASL